MVRRDEIAAKIDRIANGLAEIKMDQFSGSLPANQPGKQTDYCGSGPHRGLLLLVFSPAGHQDGYTESLYSQSQTQSVKNYNDYSECINSVNSPSFQQNETKDFKFTRWKYSSLTLISFLNYKFKINFTTISELLQIC